MVKNKRLECCIVEDEYYPYYDIAVCTHTKYGFPHVSYEIPEKLYKDWLRVEKQFKKLQKELQKVYESERGQW